MAFPEELLFRSRRQLKIFIASETAECGLACVAMIANYWRRDIDLNYVRQLYPISMSGMTLGAITELSERLEFSTRPLRIDLDELPLVQVPAILHWNMNHFVVLKQATKDWIEIYDPAKGVLKISYAEASPCFTGVVLELAPSRTFEPKGSPPTLKITQLWSSIVGLKRSTALAFILSLTLLILSFLSPLQMQLIIDKAIGNNDQSILLIVCIVFTSIGIFQGLSGFVRELTLQMIGRQFVYQIAGNIFRHLIRLPGSYFENRHVGDIVSRMSSVSTIQDILSRGTIAIVIDSIMVISSAGMMLVYSPKLGALALAAFTLIFVTNLIFVPFQKAKAEEMVVANAFAQTHLLETLRAMTPIKLMGGEVQRETDWRNLYVRGMNAAASNSVLNQSSALISSSVNTLVTGIILYAGVNDILLGAGFSLGMLTAFMAYRGTFMDRGMSVIGQTTNFLLLRLQLERLGDIVAQEKEVVGQPISLSSVKGEIALDNISFRYGSSDKYIFRNQFLKIKAGDFVAIVGSSGGGKSTLLKLLLGLQSPQEGFILLDNQPACPELWREWRKKIGVVFQNDSLLSGSIASNIAFFDAHMSMDKVWKAADRARLNEEISRMPMKFNTLIGDMGSTLSGGQKQRVLLARALYRNPSMLILDEGTANLDIENEEAIADLIESLPITKIVVAHRPALIRRATRIVCVENGIISEIDKSEYLELN